MPTLYDASGQPIDMGVLDEELSGATTTGVRSPLSGHPAQGLTPTRLARLLLEAETGDATAYLEVAEEMEEKDCHYRSVLATRKMQAAGLDIGVESASDAAEDVKAADLLRDFINTDVLRHSLFDIMDALGKGYSASEILWDCEGKTWTPARIAWRDPRWFGYDDDGVTLKLKDEHGLLIPLAPAKFIVHTHKSKSGLPLRGGLARAAVWPFLFKNFDIKSWVIFCETYGHPLRLGRYGPNATKEDKETLLRAVRNIAGDHAAILPQSMTIEFRDAKAQGNAQVFERLAEYLDRQISKLVLGQTGTTDTGSRVGTADAHEHVRKDIEISDAKALAATLNRDLVRPMVDLNFGPRKRYPRLTISRPESEDITALVDNIVKLVPLGLRVESSVMADKLGLPDPDAGALCLAAGFAPAETETETARRKELASMGARGPEEQPDDIDMYIDEELGGWRPLAEPLIDPAAALLDECGSYEEFIARLPEAVGAQDAEALAHSLAKAMFTARYESETKP